MVKKYILVAITKESTDTYELITYDITKRISDVLDSSLLGLCGQVNLVISVSIPPHRVNNFSCLDEFLLNLETYFKYSFCGSAEELVKEFTRRLSLWELVKDVRVVYGGS